MEIWFAGVPGGGKPGICKRERELFLQDKNHRLHSYYHMIETKGHLPMNHKVDLFLDSGAYSAFTQGVEIDIQEYISFIKEHQDVISVYANLDTIGQDKTSAKQTYQNQRIMEEAGLSPLPVFHLHEPFKYLKLYCERYDYISLGGMVGSSSKILSPWIDKCFSEFICDETGLPKVKVHGFGMTSLKLMLRYPWYSVDSTSWVLTGRLGGIYVPRFANGKWIYDENSWKIAVSERSPSKKEAGKHISTLTKRQKQIILDYIHDKGYRLGESEFRWDNEDYELKENERWFEKAIDGQRQVETIIESGLCNTYQLRDELNVIYFKDLEKSMPEWPWKFKSVHGIGKLL
jgi:hypothetical protein